MPTTSETALTALLSALVAGLPSGVLVGRNLGLPERVPPEGAVILRDGQPGTPQVLLSPSAWIYEHRAEVDVIVDGARTPDPDARFDALKAAIGQAVAADPTLGGVCDWSVGEAPAPVDLAVEGAERLKAATIGVVLEYTVPDPLSG